MPKVFHKKEEILHRLKNIKESIGFVPTMGNLHQGHITLLEESLKENDISAVFLTGD